MAKALYGHVGSAPDRRMLDEVTRLRARVRALEFEVTRLRAENDRLVAAAAADEADRPAPASRSRRWPNPYRRPTHPHADGRRHTWRVQLALPRARAPIALAAGYHPSARIACPPGVQPGSTGVDVRRSATRAVRWAADRRYRRGACRRRYPARSVPARWRPTDTRRSVHLKSLTVKGFKSFASATTLRLEPGITCVVGPNGSGKSNVVDAIAWVLGEQGAKALRGGKMEDVIFAGTAGRAPLGRAEVTLTIDNTRRRAADRLHRGLDHPPDVPLRRERVRDQRQLVPAARHPGAALRLRHRPGDARHRRPGPARRRPARQAGGPPRLHRGGRRRPQAPQAQGKGAAQARRDADQPEPAHRPHRRAAPPAQAARAAGRGGPAGRRHPGRPARRPAAPARRRPGHPARDAGPGDRRRDRAAAAARAGRGASTPRCRSGWPSWRPRSPRTRPLLAQAQETWYQLSTLQERLRSTAPARQPSGCAT